MRLERADTEGHPMAGMQSSPEQCQFLHLMAHLVGAKKTLEIGVLLGYSSSWVALALPPGGKVIACDVSEEYTARGGTARSSCSFLSLFRFQPPPA